MTARARPDVSLHIAPPRPKPADQWTQRCIGMHRSDDEWLDRAVARCKAAGWTNCSASMLIRVALIKLDLRQAIIEGRFLHGEQFRLSSDDDDLPP